MAIFYVEGNAKNRNFSIDISRLNPNSQWANHSYNWIALEHIAKSSDDFSERHQARKEMEIAERKMKFWERQRGFDDHLAVHWRQKIYRM